jgi:hypothetical protein
MPNLYASTPPRIRTFPLAILIACAVMALSALIPGAAGASHAQAMFFEAPRDLVAVSPATQAKTLAQLQTLGVKALRVELAWGDVAPGEHSTKKPNFDATNPASYNWSAYDELLFAARRLNWPVLLTVTSPVPEWATAGHKDKNLVTRPDDKDFKEFMTAVALHYAGMVSLYAIWNEPNHPQFLRPQFNAKGKPESPRIYRGLFQAGYEGLRAAGIAKPKMLMGETAPVGYDTVSRSEIRKEGAKALLHDVAPLAFLREALCLSSKYRKAGTCGMLPVYGYSHHAYTVGSPYYRPPKADDVTIGVLSRLSQALDRAESAHAIPRHVPIYLTEFGIQSKPSILGVSTAKQAEYDAIAERIAWSSSRVAAFSQYLFRDDPLGGLPGSGVHGGVIGFQTGLETVNGARKPLYFGFPLPLVVAKQGHGFSLWGLVRPSAGATKLKVMVEPKGSKSYRTLKVVQTNSLGYWSFKSAVKGSRWRVSWRSQAGVAYNGPPIEAH